MYNSLNALTKSFGNVIEISRFRIDDGPGIRTAVFLKGCPLACIWCHNPESLSTHLELAYDETNCVNCGACVSACLFACHEMRNGIHKFDRTYCINCGECTYVCNFGALKMFGQIMSIEQVMEVVLRDKTFFDRSGGGLTITGGEPLMQADFTYDLIKESHNHGINTCIETCGYASWSTIKKIASMTDIVLYDCKGVDSEKHEIHTGVDNKLILQNLEKLDQLGKRIILRAPLIPGCNDTENDLKLLGALADYISNAESLEVMPYHPLGIGKNELIGKTPKYSSINLPSNKVIETWLQFLRNHTKKKVWWAKNRFGKEGEP